MAFLTGNAMLTVAVALLHRFSSAADLHTALNYSGLVCLVAVESFLLFSPAFFVAITIQRWKNRLGGRLAVVTGLLLSMAYFVDLALVLNLREHLFSSSFAALMVSVGPFLPHYVTWPVAAATGVLFLTWGLLQRSIWRLSGWIIRRPSKQSTQLSIGPTIGLILLAIAPIVLALIPSVQNWDRTLGEIQKTADRHPISATGWFAATDTPRYEPKSMESIRGSAAMLAQSSIPDRIVQRYRDLKLTTVTPTVQLPDIVVVITECLRGDVVTQKTMPRLLEKAQNGLWMRNHYSTGNSSNLGFFGVMFGLNAHLFERAESMPVGMFESFHQLGYRTGFFGRDGFDTFSMETFCGPERFDVCRYTTITESVQADREAVEHAIRFLDREGETEATAKQPHIALVYVYSPHEWYHEAEDVVHTIEDVSERSESLTRSKDDFRNFLNSFRFVDRLIAPLFREDRITFVMGDHGESFGEDGRTMHGTALSKVQTHVSCVGFGPGIATNEIFARTSHVDVLPTIADAIDAIPSDKTLWEGASLLKPLPNQRVIACRSITSSSHLFLTQEPTTGSEPLGYLGFFDWRTFTMAPGAEVDRFGERMSATGSVRDNIPSSWATADLMKHWLRQTFGAALADIPTDIEPTLRQTLRAEDPSVVLHSIQIAGQMGSDARLFQPQLQACLLSPHEAVRDAAFRLLHTISRTVSRPLGSP